ncbi:MAG: hypothetical protein Q8885_02190 [Candidatus Phytoplasma stylosanthis]|nr:hypothetical protein [Candidatus Phytoplasma stylosanthis]
MINDYLKHYHIPQDVEVQLGCYNISLDSGLVASLPSHNTWKDKKIEAVYFHNGFRILSNPENHTIHDLLKLTNGATKVYLFTFNTYKNTKFIALPDSPNPYQAIRNWKRENNLSTFPPLVEEGDYDIDSGIVNGIFIKDSFGNKFDIPFRIKTIGHEFETDECCYVIMCANGTYQKNLAIKYRDDWMRWMKQCYIQPGISYSGEQIRNKFGRSDKTLYDENGTKYNYEYYEKSWWQKDEFYIIGSGMGCIGHDINLPPFKNFLNTTPPPSKPKELDE